MVVIYTINFRDVNKFLTNLPKKLEKEIGQGATLDIANSAQRRIKYRFNVLGYGQSAFSSGKGRRSIQVKRTPRGYSVIALPYIALLDSPIRTHAVSIETLKQHMASPGSTMFKRQKGTKFRQKPIIFKWRGPFIRPALQALREDIPNIVERSVNDAIQNSK